MSGKLEVTATRNLGGLGAKVGPRAGYYWLVPRAVPPLLPWLAILAALGLRPNRAAAAWWIWLPLGFLAGCTLLVHLWSEDMFLFDLWLLACQLARGLVFGLALMWLLSPYWARRGLFIRFLGMFLSQSLGNGLACLSIADTTRASVWLAIAIIAGISTLVLTLALWVAGLLCRGRYAVFRILAWMTLFLVLLGQTGMYFVAFCSSEGGPWWQPGISGLVASLLCLLLFLPFLVLGFLNGWHRERLKGLLKLTSPMPVPLLPSQHEPEVV